MMLKSSRGWSSQLNWNRKLPVQKPKCIGPQNLPFPSKPSTDVILPRLERRGQCPVTETEVTEVGTWTPGPPILYRDFEHLLPFLKNERIVPTL